LPIYITKGDIVMQNFVEWLASLNESQPDGWQPDAQVGHDPLTSGLVKLSRGLQAGKGKRFTDSNVIRVQFGLTPEEQQRLWQAQIIVRDPVGQAVTINSERLAGMHTQILGTAPNLNSPTSVAPPPPPMGY